MIQFVVFFFRWIQTSKSDIVRRFENPFYVHPPPFPHPFMAIPTFNLFSKLPRFWQ